MHCPRRRRLVVSAGAWAAASVAMPVLAPGARAQSPLDLATAYPNGNFHVENLKQFAEDLATRTQGKLGVRIHAGGSLVKAPEILAAVRSGKVALAEVFGPSLASLNAVFALDAVPFLVTNYDSARKLWAATREKARTVLRADGLELLMSIPWPPQGLFSAVPLMLASDLRGLRMRENSPPVKRLAELAEAVPVRVETPDLAAAAAEGKIDLVFTSAAQGLDTRLPERLPHYYEANAWLPRNVVLMHRATWEGLPAAQRDLLGKAAQQAEERGWAASAVFARSTTETLVKQRGVKHALLTPNVRTRLERLGNRIGGETLRSGDAELLSLAGGFLR